METLYSSIYNSNSNRFSQGIQWSVEENETFEIALAIFDENEPDRWLKVAAVVPGKSVLEVLKHYKELEDDVSDIEAGRVPIPGYFGSSSSSWPEQNDDSDVPTNRKSFLTAKSGEHHKKKGVPWTEEEHRRFLMGLLKHGKGEWRNISRNFVVSKTPTQVASHAQKYFIRQQLSGAKDHKRRPSIHDITTVNLKSNTPLSDGGSSPSYTDRSNMLLSQQKPNCMPEASVGLKNAEDGSLMVFGSTHYDLLQFVASRHGISSDGLNFHPYAGAHRDFLHDFLFQTPSPIHQIHGQVRHSFCSLGANRLIG